MHFKLKYRTVEDVFSNSGSNRIEVVGARFEILILCVWCDFVTSDKIRNEAFDYYFNLEKKNIIHPRYCRKNSR